MTGQEGRAAFEAQAQEARPYRSYDKNGQHAAPLQRDLVDAEAEAFDRTCPQPAGGVARAFVVRFD
jgi:hypothetical protein